MIDYEHEIVKPTGNLPVWIMTFPMTDNDSFQIIKPHWHQGIELSYTVAGSIDKFQIDNCVYQTHPRQIIIVNSQSVHSIETRSHGRSLSIIYPYSFVANLFPKIDKVEFEINEVNNFTNIQKENYSSLQEKLQKIYDRVVSRDDQYSDLDITTWVIEVIQILLHSFIKDRTIKLSHKIFVTKRMQEILNFMQENFQQSISLDDIAHDAHISKEYLSRFFKENMGVTVANYLRNLRAHAAWRELTTNSETFTKISLKCGFSGLRSMNRALIENFGQNAAEIRNKSKKLP